MKSFKDFLIEGTSSLAKLPSIRRRLKDWPHGRFIELAGGYGSGEEFANAILDNPNDADKEKVIKSWEKWERAGISGEKYSNFPADSSFVHHIRDSIGAIDYKKTNKPDWKAGMIFGRGEIYYTKDNAIFTDAEIDYRKKKIVLTQLSTKNKGGGLGKRYMESLKSYADKNGYGIEVWKVTNERFFDSISWLEAVKKGDYAYK